MIGVVLAIVLAAATRPRSGIRPYDEYLHGVIVSEDDPEVIRQLIHDRPELRTQERHGTTSALVTAAALKKYDAALVLVSEGWDPFLKSSPAKILSGRCAVEIAIEDADMRMLDILIGQDSYGSLSPSERQALASWRSMTMTGEMQNYIKGRLEE